MYLCLVHKGNAQTPITAILSTYLLHEFIVNVKCTMDGPHRNSYICSSCNFLIQYSSIVTLPEHVKRVTHYRCSKLFIVK